MNLENAATEKFDSFIGRTIEDRYLVRKKIGEGGIGAVYLAEDKKMVDRPVVIKVLLENQSNNTDIRRKFEHEKEALSRIDHPGIVSILDAGVLPEDKPFIVMPYVTGRTLRQAMNEQEKLPLNFCADIVESFCEALETAHAAGVLHRDIKPENIILTEQPDRKMRVRLIDFGIARVMNSQVAPITEIERSIGTILYIPPEQLTGSPNQKPSADIYSCGIVVYEMLTGTLPFKPRSVIEMWQMQSEGVKLKPSAIRPELTPEVDHIILKALAYEPKERFQQVLAFGRELAHALRQLSLDSLYNFDIHTSEVTVAITGDKVSRFIEEPKSPSSSFEVKINANHIDHPSDAPRESNERQNAVGQSNNADSKSKELSDTKPEKNDNRLLVRILVWASLGAGLLIIAVPLFTYFSLKPAEVQTPPVEPKITNASDVSSSPVVQNLEFYLELQRMRNGKPFGELIRTTDRYLFETDYEIKINMLPRADGNIYLYNEGKNDADKIVYNLLFPTPKGQNGSPQVKAAEQVETDFLPFSGKPGKELIWLIWTKENVPELNNVLQAALKTETGEIDDPQIIEELKKFLQNQSVQPLEVTKDDENKRTILQSRRNIMVYRMELEHN